MTSFSDHSVLASASPRAPAHLSSPILVNHADLGSYLAGMKACEFLIVPDAPDITESHAALFSMDARIHRFRGNTCIGISTLSSRDLPRIRAIGCNVFLRGLTADLASELGGESLLVKMEKMGFRLFFDHRSSDAGMFSLRRYRVIGLAEFGLSNVFRLAAYPAISRGMKSGMGDENDGAPVRTVFVLDLIQDFEILQPFLLRCAGAPWCHLQVSVSDRVLRAPAWSYVKPFLESVGIPWFQPIGPVDTANALGTGKAILLTASESTAPGHVFSHEVCRLAPRRTISITFQHGYESVGLRHHRAHDYMFPAGVRFASDMVFTWSNPDMLPSLHPADRDKCIPVGVTKNIADEAAKIVGIEKWKLPPDKEGTTGSFRSTLILPVSSLLVAENLHSMRFVDPQRYQHFLRFIQAANRYAGFKLMVRSHPGKRTLEKAEGKMGFRHLKGNLRASDLRQFDFLVSPPSTIVLDGALTGVPTIIWSDIPSLGDCENYAKVRSISEFNELVQIRRTPDSAMQIRTDNYRWAVDNVCALNGVPQAWSKLNEIARN